MTGLHETTTARDANSREFHREQLSAMMDGALSADEARFLLRRMEHDDELADCWERWQFLGDAMRGHAGRALPADFSRRVGRAIADDLAAEEVTLAVAATPGAHRPLLRQPLLRWGGGAALAASVALAALIGSRALSPSETTPPPVVASAPIQVPAVSVPVPKPVLPAGVAEAGAAAIAAAAAANDKRAPRPHLLAGAQALPADRPKQAAAAAVVSRASRPTQAVQVARAGNGNTGNGNELVPNAEMVSKPWPRTLVPGATANGEVTAGFEGSPVFHAFPARPQRTEWLPTVTAPPAEAAAPSP